MSSNNYIEKNLAERQLEFYQFGVNQVSIENCVKDSSKSRFIFISGLPRSGTTALGNLLNLSKDVAIYTELYDVWSPYSVSHFDSQVILKLLSSHPHRHINLSILEKSKSANFVGDKRPLFFINCAKSFCNFNNHNVSVVHIFRNIKDVALSYHRRAINTEDSWSSRRGFFSAVEEMNRMNQFFLNADKNILDKFIFVNYDECFKCVDYVMDIFNKLDVSDKNCPILLQKVKDYIVYSEGVFMRKRVINSEDARAMLSRVDWHSLQFVQEHFGAKMFDQIKVNKMVENINSFSTFF